MKIDIWSDIRCPFCYIGKRKFEAGLAEFAQKEQLEISWHSFELDPSLATDPNADMYDYLAERKGQSRDWSVGMHRQVTAMAAQVGLKYDFDRAVVANTFNAHRLIQMAKEQGLDDQAEETLFRAYFTEGKNIDDPAVLADLGAAVGLDRGAVIKMLHSESYTEAVRRDQATAQALGISGVPFFLIDNKYGVSGAQAPEVFKQALEKAWSESGAGQTDTYTEGAVCGPDDNC